MKTFVLIVIAFVGAVFFWNASWLTPAPAEPGTGLIAHRGVHHTFDRTDLANDTCTAERIHPPEHALFENTIASMRAAFAAGADIVELDVHPTTDDRFAVFHDWTLDCRTEGTGETRGHDLAYLQALDIGYGYTADAGATYPLRGRGEGLMPSLAEVLDAIPDGRFIVNFKSNQAHEGDMLAQMVDATPRWRESVWGAYGGDAPTLAAKAHMPDLAIWTRRGLIDCLGQYIAYGWTGIVPGACRDTYVMVPINLSGWLWGWPNLFQQRMTEAGSAIILMGPYGAGDPGTAGIDEIETLEQIPQGFSGYVWTNRIERIGPALTSRTGT